MYVPKYDISTNNMGKRGKIDGLFEDATNNDEYQDDQQTATIVIRHGSESPPRPDRGTVGRRAGSISGIGLTRSISQPDYMQQVKFIIYSCISKRARVISILFIVLFYLFKTNTGRDKWTTRARRCSTIHL